MSCIARLIFQPPECPRSLKMVTFLAAISGMKNRSMASSMRYLSKANATISHVRLHFDTALVCPVSGPRQSLVRQPGERISIALSS